MRAYRYFAILGLAILAACGSPGGSDTFITREGATVVFSPDRESFTVNFRAGFGINDYWCAAGRAAERVAPVTARIYLLSDPGFPRGQSPRFSVVEPAGGGQPTGLATIGGDNRSVASSQARSLCGILPRQRGF